VLYHSSIEFLGSNVREGIRLDVLCERCERS
jgi:hypothetical protein